MSQEIICSGCSEEKAIFILNDINGDYNACPSCAAGWILSLEGTDEQVKTLRRI